MTTLPFEDPNGRIFYACQAVLVTKRNAAAESDATDGVYLTGVQSVGISGDMPSSSLIDIGSPQKQFHYYGQQNFEITIERRIDQSSDFFYYVDPSDYIAGESGYKSTHILNKNNLHDKGFKDEDNKSLRNYDITILYAPDKFRYIGSYLDDVTAGTEPRPPVSEGGILDPDRDKVISVTYKSCLLSSVEYSIGIDGITESITLFTKQFRYNKNLSTLSAYDINDDLPQDGNVIKRSDLDILKTGTVAPEISYSRLPQEVISMFQLGNSEVGKKILGISSISIGFSIDYNQLPDIGFWRGSEKDKEYEQNIYTQVNLPIQVTCSFTGVARRALEYGEFIWTNSADDVFVRNTDVIFGASGVTDPSTGLSYGGGPYRDGLDPTHPQIPAGKTPPSAVYNKVDRPIRLVFEKFPSPPAVQYHIIDLGSKNYVTSIGTSGGDTGGGNVETTMSYQNDYSDIVLVRDNQVRDLINYRAL